MSEDMEFEFDFFGDEVKKIDANVPRIKKQTEVKKETKPEFVKKKKTVTITKPKTQKKKKDIKLPTFKKKKTVKNSEPKKVEEKKTNPVEKKPKKKFVFDETWKRPHARKLDRKGKVIANVEKQIEKNLNHPGRFTAPKSRNLLARYILQKRLENDGFFDIEADYEYLTQEEVDKSRFANNKKDKKLYKQVQAYEDAVDDDKFRKGLMAFKVGLAVIMIATMIGVTSNVVKSFTGAIIPTSQVQVMTEEERAEYIQMINSFVLEVEEKDGYKFDYISMEDIQNTFSKIKKVEKNMNEKQYEGAWRGFRDQEFVDKIVIRALGEEEYQKLTENQKRDYRQLAFEILPEAKPEIFENAVPYIRNPIVYDELQAKNAAKEKGYKTELIVNSDRPEVVKNFGRILHLRNMLDEDDFEAASKVNDGQDLLEGILRESLGEEKYNELRKNERRDYIQLIYELLPESAKGTYIKDPLELEKEPGLEIGE